MIEWCRSVAGVGPRGQLVRYALVGVASNIGGYLLYLLITHLGVAPKYAMTVLYMAGATLGFIGNHSLTFDYQGGFFSAGVRYVVAHAVGYVMNLALLLFFVDQLGLPHQLVQAAAVLVVGLYLFVAFKFFVFPACDNSLAEGPR